MSKRRKKGNTPNIPQATLDRAREQAGLPVEEPIDEAEEVEVEEAPKPRAAAAVSSKNKSATRSAASSRRSKKAPSATQIDMRKRRGELDTDTVEAALAHPVRFPTEEDLHAEYGFVLRDLRNMFLLAGVLMVIMIAVASFL
ncbi:hypothetical protein G4Y79_23090 [Phototrophicus methaneseepsis]|uniref:Uncharacterized protein n=1 Tax=Phototrophicus methaneseepsis TaxID=2710758 RepID=A0A7S8E8X4_9CHLR|nr:hypothetical protein [Phototrophicus methaneseepsis]QPC82537.1 hypothetical protein G4Y79_23090 [Phototrophicus methaneseepsis]